MLESTFATLAAKLAAGGIAVAMAATGGLAGTGNLPDRAQTAISEAMSNVGVHIPTGDESDDVAAEALEAAEEAAAEALQQADEATEGEEDGETGKPNENAAFGQSVAEDARDGGVDGREISERARAMAEERKAAGQANRPAGSGTEDEGSPQAGAPADAGSQSQTGLDTAKDTPAGDHIPALVPGGRGRPSGTPGR